MPYRHCSILGLSCLAELCCLLGSPSIHKKIQGQKGWSKFVQKAILFLLIAFFFLLLFLPPAKFPVTLVEWTHFTGHPDFKKAAFPRADEKGGSHGHGAAACSPGQSADLGKYLLCAPSVLMHIFPSFPLSLIQLCTWCCFPMTLIWVCIRKQEEKEELLKSASAYPVALTETGWKISERKFLCWQNARLIKSKWASQHKCEFLRFPVRSVGWWWGEPWFSPVRATAPWDNWVLVTTVFIWLCHRKPASWCNSHWTKLVVWMMGFGNPAAPKSMLLQIPESPQTTPNLRLGHKGKVLQKCIQNTSRW